MPQSLKSQSVDLEALVAYIRALTEIESPTSDRGGVNRVLNAVEEAFEGSGAKLQRIPTGDVYGDMLKISCHPGRDEPGILVLSHVDTVHPVGALSGALPICREGDRLYGPGVYDMKAGAAIAQAAALRILKDGRKTQLPVTLLLTPDEEVGSPVSRQTIEEEALRNTCVLVTEPARDGGKIVTARKGVGRFRIVVKGRPAHAGSHHHMGRNAIREMARIILQVEDFTDYDRGVTASVGLVRGGTGVNVIPEHCMAEADLRMCDLAAADEMVARFLALRSSDPDIEVRVTGELNRPPYARDGAIDGLFSEAARIAAEIGFKLESVALAGGGSDGNFTVGVGVPTLDGLGCDGEGAHTNHEHILISSIVPRTLLLQGLMERLR